MLDPRTAHGFANFILSQSDPARKLKDPATSAATQAGKWTKDQRQAALTGILGMMRFADFDNPILTEALGDVLRSGEADENAAHLAAQAFLQASRKSAKPADQERIGNKLEWAGMLTEGFQMRNEVKALNASLAEGAALAAKVRADEIAWIKAGKDADAEFQKKYLK